MVTCAKHTDKKGYHVEKILLYKNTFLSIKL